MWILSPKVQMVAPGPDGPTGIPFNYYVSKFRVEVGKGATIVKQVRARAQAVIDVPIRADGRA
jgi:hypothetical protein